MLRKKRVTISEQAQAAIAAGMPVDDALAEHGTPVPAADASPNTDPVTPAPAAIDPPAEGTPAAAAGDPAADDGVQDPNLAEASATEGVEVEASSNNDAMSSVLDRLQVAQNTIATQAAEITQLQTSAEQMGASQGDLMAVTVKATHIMQIALGGTALDLSHLDATNLLAQYRSTLATFETKIPVGGKAEVPVDDGSHDGKVVPLVSPAVARATQIRK
jgi:hypothetical protein